MSILTKPVPAKPPEDGPLSEPNAHVFTLYGVSWEAYCTLRDSLDRNHQSRVRLTFDNGRLDIVAPGHTHEWPKMALDRGVIVLTQEYGLPRRSLGSTTFRKEIEQKGFEPDQSYFVKREKLAPFRARPKVPLDISTLPPPDLTI